VSLNASFLQKRGRVGEKIGCWLLLLLSGVVESCVVMIVH
jgi:hypothetical protein